MLNLGITGGFVDCIIGFSGKSGLVVVVIMGAEDAGATFVEVGAKLVAVAAIFVFVGIVGAVLIKGINGGCLDVR